MAFRRRRRRRWICAATSARELEKGRCLLITVRSPLLTNSTAFVINRTSSFGKPIGVSLQLRAPCPGQVDTVLALAFHQTDSQHKTSIPSPLPSSSELPPLPAELDVAAPDARLCNTLTSHGIFPQNGDRTTSIFLPSPLVLVCSHGAHQQGD